MKFVKFLEELNSSHQEEVGCKAATLGELITLGVAVPPGFTISADAFHYFCKTNRIVGPLLDQEQTVDLLSTSALEAAASRYRSLIKEVLASHSSPVR